MRFASITMAMMWMGCRGAAVIQDTEGGGLAVPVGPTSEVDEDRFRTRLEIVMLDARGEVECSDYGIEELFITAFPSDDLGIPEVAVEPCGRRLTADFLWFNDGTLQVTSEEGLRRLAFPTGVIFVGDFEFVEPDPGGTEALTVEIVCQDNGIPGACG